MADGSHLVQSETAFASYMSCASRIARNVASHHCRPATRPCGPTGNHNRARITSAGLCEKNSDEHPAVLLGTDERVRLKPRVCVLLCSSPRANRKPELHEVLLDTAHGLNWETLCKCDVVYAVSKGELVQRRGVVTPAPRRAIAERVIRGLGLAGL
jgi:hypothetical protein